MLGASFSSIFGSSTPFPGWSYQKAVDLLEPWAYAQGQGLPWEDLWGTLACAISSRSYTDGEIRDLLQHAAPYLVESIEHGRSVYRLFHQALADHFLQQGQVQENHRRIARSLQSRTAMLQNGRPDWTRAHPYVRGYLSLHAAEGRCLDDYVVDPFFLVVMDPNGLKLVLSRCVTEEGQCWARAYSIATL